MNDKQNSNLNMFQTVSDLLEANKSKYEGIVVFNNAVVELKENIGLIREQDKDRSETIVPASTAEKQEVEDKMVNNAVIVARLISVYAFDTGNQTLGMQTNVSKSNMYKLHDNEELARAKTILNSARENITPLAGYGTTEGMLDDLATSISDFEAVIAKPRGTINERKGQTQSLAKLFADTKSLLIDRLDKLIGVFKESDKDFYNAYFAARNVINTSYRRSTVEENKK